MSIVYVTVSPGVIAPSPLASVASPIVLLTVKLRSVRTVVPTSKPGVLLVMDVDPPPRRQQCCKWACPCYLSRSVSRRETPVWS